MENDLCQVENFNTDLVYVENNDVWTNSRTIAQKFKRQHYSLIRDIETLLINLEGVHTSVDTSRVTFIRVERQNEQNGQYYTEYQLNENAFMLLVMGFNNTPTVLDWKLKYIAAFNYMRKLLSNPLPQLFDIDSRLKIARLVAKTPTRNLPTLKNLFPEYFNVTGYISAVDSYRDWIETNDITYNWIVSNPTIEVFHNYTSYCVQNKIEPLGKKIFFRALEDDFKVSKKQRADGKRYFVEV